jgi:hypothetical protein
MAISLPIKHTPIVTNDKNSTGNLMLSDGVIDDGIKNRKAGIKRSGRMRRQKTGERTGERRSADFSPSVSRLL